MKRLARWLALLAISVLLVLAAGGAAAWWWITHPLPLAAASVELSIEPGTAPREVAQDWVDAGVVTSPFWLYEWFRWSGQARRIRAGSYRIDASTSSPQQILAKMVQGDETMQSLRLIEGWTFRQMRAELARASTLRSTISSLTDAQVMTAIGADKVPPEGRFFPDTYTYGSGVSDLTVLKRAYQSMQRHLDAAWLERAPDSPLKSPEQALILASIVEKETGTPADRARIAGVFTNRLRLGMALQTDPTVIYGLGEAFDGNLRRRDLLADGPYNTYTRAGLPPTPISMPGRASLLAAVRPDPTKALYFVSRGDGSSEFSESLADHNRAVNKYQRGR